MFNKIGFGNPSYRNGTLFTSSLLYKHDVFFDLLINSDLLNFPQEFFGGEFTLSEFKIISSIKDDNFKYWWHRDHPYVYDSNDRDIGTTD